MKYYLYRHIREDKNEPFYIGIGSKTINDFKYFTYTRAYTKDNRNFYWKNIIKNSNYKIDILFESNNYDFIKNKEKEFIKLYGRKDLNLGSLCNLTDGGEGTLGSICSIETKRKLSFAGKGSKNHFYGKTHSKEAKEKIANSRKNKLLSDEIKLKISNKIRRENHYCAKIILNLENGIYYGCAKDAAEIYNIKYKTLIGKLCGKNKNNTPLIYC